MGSDPKAVEKLPINDSESDYWLERKRCAKYLCPDCGMPDGWHTVDCPSDTDVT